MRAELCDLCECRVDEYSCTRVTIKDYKGIDYDFGMAFPDKRKFEGVICDDCLNLLIRKKKINRQSKCFTR